MQATHSTQATRRLSLQELTIAFDAQRFSGTDAPVEHGVVINRPRGDHDEIIVRIETGIAAGFEAFARMEDLPGGTADARVIFFARAKVGGKIRFTLHSIGHAGIRIRPLPLDTSAIERI